MTIMTEKETKDKKKATSTLLSLLFPGYVALFTPRSIMLQGESNILIDETNFDIFQSISLNNLKVHHILLSIVHTFSLNL